MTNWAIVGLVIAAVSALFVGLSTLVTYRIWRNSTRAKDEEDGKWKGRVDTLLEKIEKDLFDLRQIVFARLGIPLVISKSPLRLTEFGKSVSEEIGALSWIERVSNTLKEEVKGMDAYGIQDFCFEYVENTDQYNDEEQRAIRNSAYKRGIKAKDVRRVLAIELRDKLLENAGLEAPEESQEI